MMLWKRIIDSFHSRFNKVDRTVVNTSCHFCEPSNLHISEKIQSDNIIICWNPVEGAANYELWRGEDSNAGRFILLTITVNTSYEDNSIVVDKEYYYRVRAVKDNLKSSFSSIISGRKSLKIN